MFSSCVRCICSLQKRDKENGKHCLGPFCIKTKHFNDLILVKTFILFFILLLVSSDPVFMKSWVDKASCHKLSMLNSFLFEDKCSCSDFPNWTSDRHLHKQKCNTSASDSSPRLKEGVREKERES